MDRLDKNASNVENLLKEKKVICVELATKKELEIVMKLRKEESGQPIRVNPKLLHNDPASKYIW